MGYGVRIHGKIELDPPFSKSKLSDPTHLDDDHRIMFVTENKVVRTEEHGPLIALIIVAIGPADEERDLSAINLEEDLQEMHDEAVAAGVTSFDGYIYAIGEESGDIERFWFDPHDGTLQHDRAQLSWPDGTPVAKEIYAL
jgi:hypothetical protein